MRSRRRLPTRLAELERRTPGQRDCVRVVRSADVDLVVWCPAGVAADHPRAVVVQALASGLWDALGPDPDARG